MTPIVALPYPRGSWLNKPESTLPKDISIQAVFEDMIFKHFCLYIPMKKKIDPHNVGLPYSLEYWLEQAWMFTTLDASR